MEQPAWRVRFNVISRPGEHFDLVIDDQVVMGRGTDLDNMVDLTPYNGELLGVSRRHVMLRPTLKNLFVMDLGSKQGTLSNGLSIGVRTPYPLKHGDVLTLGKLSLQLIIGGYADADPMLVPAYR